MGYPSNIAVSSDGKKVYISGQDFGILKTNAGLVPKKTIANGNFYGIGTDANNKKIYVAHLVTDFTMDTFKINSGVLLNSSPLPPGAYYECTPRPDNAFLYLSGQTHTVVKINTKNGEMSTYTFVRTVAFPGVSLEKKILVVPTYDEEDQGFIEIVKA